MTKGGEKSRQKGKDKLGEVWKHRNRKNKSTVFVSTATDTSGTP